jgi:2-polyprenyl-3-methyl-5-hydroxy-6-metoxy-1,4-benzoquinol methylase
MTTPACRLCGGPDLHPGLHYQKSPRYIERLLEAEERAADYPVPLTVVVCGDCGHVQLPVELAGDYYEEYLMSHSHAPKMRRFQEGQAQAFVERFNLRGGEVFEAGCGDGQFASMLMTLGCRVTANEPSAKARRACAAKGLTVIGGYVAPDGMPELRGRFDAVVARQVLEHVPAPVDFMAGLRGLLKPGGAALIEVPSLEQALEQERFFDFFSDHLSYFSENALRMLAARTQFEVVQIRRAMDGEYNEVWLRRLEPPNLAGVAAAAREISSAFAAFISVESQAGRRVAIWGAGAKGVLALAMVDTSAVAYLVDKDPVKHDRYLPVSHLRVSPPQRLREDPVDTVIITALAYKDEITRELRGECAFGGRIACLQGGSIQWLE